MLRLTLALLLVAVAATEAKTRRHFLPQSLANQRRFWFTPDEKIVGGTPAKAGEIPWQVSFQDLNYDPPFHFCGGSIYNEEWVICAAHCVTGEDFDLPDYLQVVAGDLDQSVEEGNEQAIYLSKIVQHEDYGSTTFNNDISLLKLSRPLVFNDFVAPIALPTQLQNSTGDSLVSGWGTLSAGGITPDVLHKVTIPVIDDDVCRDQYGQAAIYDSMICAGIPGVGGVDSCQGDSGGPMVCSNDDGSQYLCGIVSWGRGCALPNFAGVYTEVSHFVDWIETNTAA
jgi:secreted trypsin-like serine protease